MLVSSVRSAGRASPLPAAALSVPLLPLLRCRGRGVVRCHGGGGATLDMAPNTRAQGGSPRAMTTRTVWRVCYGGVWAFGIASTLHAGERVHRTVVIDGRSFPAEIVILVDASGSMSERSRYPLAVTEALAVAEQASDAGPAEGGAFGAALGGARGGAGPVPARRHGARGRGQPGARRLPRQARAGGARPDVADPGVDQELDAAG